MTRKRATLLVGLAVALAAAAGALLTVTLATPSAWPADAAGGGISVALLAAARRAWRLGRRGPGAYWVSF